MSLIIIAMALDTFAPTPTVQTTYVPCDRVQFVRKLTGKEGSAPDVEYAIPPKKYKLPRQLNKDGTLFWDE